MKTTATGEITCECRVKIERAGPFEQLFIGLNAGSRARAGHPEVKYQSAPASWEWNDGSKFNATQLAMAPNGTENIMLQLVKANAAVSTGKMQGMKHIQRVAT